MLCFCGSRFPPSATDYEALFAFYRDLHFAYLEINPIALLSNNKVEWVRVHKVSRLVPSPVKESGQRNPGKPAEYVTETRPSE